MSAAIRDRYDRFVQFDGSGQPERVSNLGMAPSPIHGRPCAVSPLIGPTLSFDELGGDLSFDKFRFKYLSCFRQSRVLAFHA